MMLTNHCGRREEIRLDKSGTVLPANQSNSYEEEPYLTLFTFPFAKSCRFHSVLLLKHMNKLKHFFQFLLVTHDFKQWCHFSIMTFFLHHTTEITQEAAYQTKPGSDPKYDTT